MTKVKDEGSALVQQALEALRGIVAAKLPPPPEPITAKYAIGVGRVQAYLLTADDCLVAILGELDDLLNLGGG